MSFGPDSIWVSIKAMMAKPERSAEVPEDAFSLDLPNRSFLHLMSCEYLALSEDTWASKLNSECCLRRVVGKGEED